MKKPAPTELLARATANSSTLRSGPFPTQSCCLPRQAFDSGSKNDQRKISPSGGFRISGFFGLDLIQDIEKRLGALDFSRQPDPGLREGGEVLRVLSCRGAGG